jgi:dinuclear metal center YbgI/SA1388 family protein
MSDSRNESTPGAAALRRAIAAEVTPPPRRPSAGLTRHRPRPYRARMASRDEIVGFLDDLLEIAGWEDYGPNGLQVPGATEVEVVATGVSAHRELFERAAELGAQLLLTHHGMFWEGDPPAITPKVRARLEILFGADISLAAYHLPLDAHPDVGNNALICEGIGFRRSEPFGEYKGRPLGWVGRHPDGVPAGDLFASCARLTGREPLVFHSGPETVRSVGIVSGAASSSLAEAAALGLDAFLTGEPSEFVMADAREAGLHFIGAGHYATETFGVRRLGDLVAERFGVGHVFVEVPNPI